MTIAIKTCNVDGCEKPAHCGGTKCGMHYSRLSKHGSTELPVIQSVTRQCDATECVTIVRSRNADYCSVHYNRFIKYGDATFAKHKRGESRKKNPLYSLYSNIKYRCYNPHYYQYDNYHGRGIVICDRWLGLDGFTHFCEDMGERPIGTTIDRIDNDKGYSPENCRWASPSVQAINRRVRRTSKSGVAGVFFVKSRNIWIAEVRSNGKRITKNCKDMATAVKIRKEMYNKYYKPLLDA